MIHNISIATDDGIIQVRDDLNIYPVYLSKAIIICGNCVNWLEKTIVSDHIFLSISCKLIWEFTYGHRVYVKNWYPFFTNVKNRYQILTHVKN